MIECYNKKEVGGYTFGYFYEYEEENGNLKRKIIGNISTAHKVKTILKSISSIYEYQKNGDFQIINFSGGSISFTDSYNLNENFISRKNKMGDITIQYKYTYDKKGNWISLENIGGIFPEKFTRTIEYY